MNIFVGNLAAGVSSDDLQRAFENFGQVDSIKIVQDAASGASKDFGFVRMANESDGQEAMSALNGSELKGQKIQVNPARKRSDRRVTDRRSSRGRGSGQKGKERRNGSRRGGQRRSVWAHVGKTRADEDRLGARGRH